MNNPPQDTQAAGRKFQKLQKHLHLPIVFGMTWLAFFTFLYTYRSNDVRIAFGGIMLSVALPFLLYLAVDFVVPLIRLRILFLEFIIAVGVLLILFPTYLEIIHYLWFPTLFLCASTLVSLRSERNSSKRRVALAAAKEIVSDTADKTKDPTPMQTRLEGAKKKTEGKERPFRVKLAYGLYVLALIMVIEYFLAHWVNSMGASTQGRTKYTACLLILASPAIIYGVLHYLARGATMGALSIHCLVSMVILGFILPGSLAYESLWFAPACFALGFMASLKKRKARKRRWPVYIPKEFEAFPDSDQEKMMAAQRRTGRRNRSKVENVGWSSTFYSWFRKS